MVSIDYHPLMETREVWAEVAAYRRIFYFGMILFLVGIAAGHIIITRTHLKAGKLNLFYYLDMPPSTPSKGRRNKTEDTCTTLFDKILLWQCCALAGFVTMYLSLYSDLYESRGSYERRMTRHEALTKYARHDSSAIVPFEEQAGTTTTGGRIGATSCNLLHESCSTPKKSVSVCTEVPCPKGTVVDTDSIAGSLDAFKEVRLVPQIRIDTPKVLFDAVLSDYPVVIRGAWRDANALRWDSERFRQYIETKGCGGRVKVNEYDPRNLGWGGLNRTTMDFKEYVSRIQRRSDDEHHVNESSGKNSTKIPYLFDSGILEICPEMLKDFEIPKLFGRDLVYEVTPYNIHGLSNWPSLFIGGAGQKSELHQDNAGSQFWLVLVRGRKLWRTVRVQDLDKSSNVHRKHLTMPELLGGGASSSSSSSSEEGKGNMTRFEIFNPDGESQNARHAAIAKSMVVYETVLEPGDALYNPGFGFHAGFNLEDDTFSVAGNVVNEAFWKDFHAFCLFESKGRDYCSAALISRAKERAFSFLQMAIDTNHIAKFHLRIALALNSAVSRLSLLFHMFPRQVPPKESLDYSKYMISVPEYLFKTKPICMCRIHMKESNDVKVVAEDKELVTRCLRSYGYEGRVEDFRFEGENKCSALKNSHYFNCIVIMALLPLMGAAILYRASERFFALYFRQHPPASASLRNEKHVTDYSGNYFGNAHGTQSTTRIPGRRSD